MLGMFNFFQDCNNYEDRKVDRYEEGDLLISTAFVSDGIKPYETAIAHPSYNNGAFIIVEHYDIKEDAVEGHKKWVDIMTSEHLPDTLCDCKNAMISNLLQDDLIFERGSIQPKEASDE